MFQRFTVHPPMFNRRVPLWTGIPATRLSSTVPLCIMPTLRLPFLSGRQQKLLTSWPVWLRATRICFTCVSRVSTKLRARRTTVSPRVSIIRSLSNLHFCIEMSLRTAGQRPTLARSALPLDACTQPHPCTSFCMLPPMSPETTFVEKKPTKIGSHGNVS